MDHQLHATAFAPLSLDPNVWFRNVEYVADKDIGQETVQYVSNIYKYYFAYRQVVTLRQRKKAVTDRG
jgi:membrane-bound lytic murein transglycosylase MltF